ncbi:hypothetical protein B0H10DRAFT_1884443 [Mycena sp. CBHHK59/15]|nr:hypothetical protein B0H10DRAFT_1884443 [Mycena sp. CBHHK59/15]
MYSRSLGRWMENPLRPALKQTTSRATGPKSISHEMHVSFLIPNWSDSAVFTMHSLFAYTHLDHAPISCDISYLPTSRSILDRSTRKAIPYETLDEPATEPPLYDKLVLKSDLLPWEVVVFPNASNSCQCPSSAKQKFRFARRQAITNLDVLHALYDVLSERVTPDEWAGLGRNSRVQRRISRAYQQRCISLGSGWESGVRRIDWLEGRTLLVGIEMLATKNGPAASDVRKLVFKSPA